MGNRLSLFWSARRKRSGIKGKGVRKIFTAPGEKGRGGKKKKGKKRTEAHRKLLLTSDNSRKPDGRQGKEDTQHSLTRTGKKKEELLGKERERPSIWGKDSRVQCWGSGTNPGLKGQTPIP